MMTNGTMNNLITKYNMYLQTPGASILHMHLKQNNIDLEH